MTRRFWIGLVARRAGVALEMGGHLVGLHMWLPPQASNWIQLALATPVVLWAGWPFFERGWRRSSAQPQHVHADRAWGRASPGFTASSRRRARPVSRRHSGARTARSPSISRRRRRSPCSCCSGQVLELRAREQTGGAIRALLDLAPKTARRIRADGSERKSPSTLSRSAIVCAFARAKRFRSMASCSKAAARSTNPWSPASRCRSTKAVGAKLIGGTINGTGGFVMRADKVGRDTMLAQIVQMVAQAQRSRAPIQRLADQVSGWFVPLVIAVAALLSRLGRSGARAALCLRAGRRGVGADHRLPLRAWAGDADVDHGRRRARRAVRAC